MERSPDYVLKYICGKPRLLPCGQINANLSSDIILNETGAYIWANITPGITLDELVDKFCKDYDCTEDEDIASARNVVTNFTKSLALKGILYDPYAIPCIRTQASMAVPALPPAPTLTIEIGGLNMAIYGDKSIIPDDLYRFESTGTNIIQNIYLHESMKPNPAEEYQRLCVSKDVEVYVKNDNQLIFFPLSDNLEQAQANSTNDTVHIFYKPGNTEAIKEELFPILGNFFFYRAQQLGLFVLHSASLIYKGKAWLFSAPSGVGKTTHTNLWGNVPGVTFFNGDVNLIKEKADGSFSIFGLPWCGTSGISEIGEYPLGGIVFVNQSPTDYTENMSDEDKITSILHRMISPMWAEAMIDKNLDFASKVVKKIMTCKLFCTMNITAMQAMRQKIDDFLK